jgi:prepilin-type N-terminal cleavage/methylation domain-containing protein
MIGSYKYSNRDGITLIEVVIAIAIVLLVLTFTGLAINQYVQARTLVLNDVRKVFLTEQGYEMARFMRDSDWSQISARTIGQPFFLSVSTSTITLSSTPELIFDRYHRQLILESVYRDPQGVIVGPMGPGGTLDNQARHLLVQVGDQAGTTTFRSLLVNFSAL